MAAKVLKIDTHNHFWLYGKSDLYWIYAMGPGAPIPNMLRRSYEPADMKPWMDKVGVDRTIIVQAAHSGWDNWWWLDLAEKHDFIGGVVGWVDLADPNVGKFLDDLRRHPYFRGVRACADDEADDAWLVRDEVRRGIREVIERDLTLDLMVRARSLPSVIQVAEENPGGRLVVDHMAKPPLHSGTIDQWRERMSRLKPYNHLQFKLSGLFTECGEDKSVNVVRPVVQFALETYGVSRLMWGSDWPVSATALDYQTTYNRMVEAIGPVSETDRAAIFGGNAAKFYRVE